MKHIRIGVVLFVLCILFSIGAKAQTEVLLDSIASDNDSLVNVAYRKIHKNDLMNAVSVLNPSDYLDKNFSTYALDGVDAFIGGSNLWAIGDALILVDGVPRPKYEIITEEIEQITFLKGANAAVLYGSRAANGVVLITTKRGKIGERKSNVRFNSGIDVPKSYPEYLGSAEYFKYNYQARLNDGATVTYDSTSISNYESGNNPYLYPDVDYYSNDYLKKMYNTYQATADFSGGNDKARFYALAGFEKQNSLLNFGEGKNEGSNRLNLRGNIDLDLNDYIKTYINMSNVFYDKRSANSDYWNQSTSILPNRIAPLIPIDLINSNDALILANDSRNIIDGKYLLGANTEYPTNPIADVYAAGFNTYTNRQFQYTSGLDIDLKNALEGLSFHGQMGIDYSNSYKQSVNYTYASFIPTWSETEQGDSITGLDKNGTKDRKDGSQNLSDNINSQVVDFNMHFDYINTFNKFHNVSVMALAAAYRGRKTGDYQFRTNANLGLQLAYNYDQKYYFDFSGAIVNSTKLPENTRIALSPTLSLGWLISDEAFLNESTLFNSLKLIASAGIINTDLDIERYYMYDAEFESNAYHSWADGDFVNQATSALRGANENMNYVKRKELSFGLDGTLLSNAIDFKTNVFFIKKEGLLAQSVNAYPNFFVTGWPVTSFVPNANFEANGYKGLDFQLNFKKQLGEVKLNVGVVATYVTTKALIRDEIEGREEYLYEEGKPIDAIFGLESLGLFASQEEIDNHAKQFGGSLLGDIKYKDQNGDGIIDDNDQIMIGRGRWGSPLTGGYNFTAEYRNFTLFVYGTAQFGGTSIKDNSYYWVYGDRKYSAVVRDSWTEETKTTATYPRLTTSSGGNNFRTSDFWAFSTNRVTLSRVQLTYTFPKSILNIPAVQVLKIYASGANLLTLSKNKDIMELNIGSTPQTRFYNLGIKAEF